MWGFAESCGGSGRRSDRILRASGPGGRQVGFCVELRKAPGLTGMEEEMEELYVEGVATHGDPESCVDVP